MSSMAKIFVVVNLVLAVATFGAAATLLGAQDNYKEAYATVVKKFEEYNDSAKRQLKAAEDRVGQMEREKQEADGNFQNQRAENSALQQTISAAQAENTKLRSANQQHADNGKRLTTINEGYQNAIAAATTKADEATQAKMDAQRELEAEIGNRARLEAEVSALNAQVKSLAAQIGDLKSENRRLKFENSQMAKNGAARIGGGKGANGRVNGVRTVGTTGAVLVSISVGSEDGVSVGDKYHIRRGGDYIGMIKITYAGKGIATGEFDREFNADRGDPQSGDTAYADR